MTFFAIASLFQPRPRDASGGLRKGVVRPKAARCPDLPPDHSGGFRHLRVFKLDRGCPAENADRDLQARIVLVDILDQPRKTLEVAIGNADLLADLEGDGRARTLDTFLDLGENARDLRIRERRRLALRPEKTGDTVDRGDRMIGAIIHVHLDEHIARHEAALDRDLAPAPYLGDFFGRNNDLLDLVLQPLLANNILDRFGNSLLEIREHAYRIPTLCHRRPALFSARRSPCSDPHRPGPHLRTRWDRTDSSRSQSERRAERIAARQ